VIAPTAPRPPDPALDRYRQRMRRSRTIYYAVVGVVVAVLGVVVGLAWSNGEAAHASLHTVPKAPSSEALQVPSTTPVEAWRSTDRAAIGTPQWGGTIVTYSTHTVGGRDARTGKQTWTYTRTDRTVCTAAQLNGVTIAVYDDDGNCDEVSAFASGTGQRRWTRTLDFNGMPVDGHPTYQFTPYTFMVTTPSVIYTIDPVTGYNRWTYQRYGCTIEHAVLGTAGALISQNCSARVQCAKLKFCGRGPQLFLRDGSAATGDDNDNNADQITWNDLGDRGVPVSADGVISALRPGGQLELYDAKHGKTTPLTLDPQPTSAAGATAISADPDEVVWLSGVTYAISPSVQAVVWHTTTAGPPTVVATDDQPTPTLSTARITAGTMPGVAIIDGTTGRVSAQFRLDRPGRSGFVYPLGSGFLTTGPSGVVVYR
jgi:hypothetical protein